MLCDTAVLLEDEEGQGWRDWGWRARSLELATLESFLTHARSLMDFVCPPSDYETRTTHAQGMFASDYCTAPWAPQPWPELRAEHRRISTEVQHLSLDRPAGGSEWSYGELRDKLIEMLRRFVDEADLLPEDSKERLGFMFAGSRRASTPDSYFPRKK